MKNFIKKHSVKYGALSVKFGALTAAVLSTAANASVADSITSAVADGQSNYTLVVVGLIGLAAIGFGLRAIVGAMR